MPDNQLYSGSDTHFHYTRIYALMEAIQDGRFPVYIQSSEANGFGHGTNLFYPDFMLIPIALLAIATNLIFAYKAFVFFVLFFSGWFSYLAISKISGSKDVAYLSALFSNCLNFQ